MKLHWMKVQQLSGNKPEQPATVRYFYKFSLIFFFNSISDFSTNSYSSNNYNSTGTSSTTTTQKINDSIINNNKKGCSKKSSYGNSS
jgi:hypothetical protein